MGDEPTEIGDYVGATLVRRTEQNLWESEVDHISNDWTPLFNPRSDESWKAGDSGYFRIYKIVPQKREILLSADSFGFTPISDRMRPRYRHAIQSMLLWFNEGLHENAEIAGNLPIHVSEAKGMFNRCIRQDQWDWFDVWTGLGKPSFSDMRLSADLLTRLRAELRNDGTTADILDQLKDLALESRFLLFLDHIEQSYEGLPKGRRENTLQPSPRSQQHQSTRPSTRAIDKEKLNYANQEHRRTLHILCDLLDKYGYYPEANTFIDVFTRLRSGPAIFEVKSISQDNELSQVRHAISQLYEYRYRHSYPDATLWLVLSRKPDSSWLASYLLEDRKIELLWVENETLTGPSFEELGITNVSMSTYGKT